MNWSYRIIILYSVFVAGILYLVFRCVGEEIDLVETDYYDRELEFQNRIEGLENAENSAFRMKVGYDVKDQLLIIEYPDTLQNSKNEGKIIFYRPDNADLDFSVPIDAINGKQLISTHHLQRGFWRIKIDFTAGETALYQEEKIFF